MAGSQYHSQDEDGNFSFGYSNVNSARREVGNGRGGVRGSYSYKDQAGTHTVEYVADRHGFRLV